MNANLTVNTSSRSCLSPEPEPTENGPARNQDFRAGLFWSGSGSENFFPESAPAPGFLTHFLKY